MKTTYSTISLYKMALLFVVVSFFTSYSVFSQINTDKIRLDINSLSFRACGSTNNGISTVTVQSKQNTTTDFEIAFNLPIGVLYRAGSGIITDQTGSADYSLIEVDISNLNEPVFRLERPSNAPWQINDLVTFTYEKTADCEAVQFSYSGGLFKDAHTITFLDSDGPQQTSNTDNTVASYNILRAFLAVDDIPRIAAGINQPVSRNIIVRNSGNGSIESFVHRIKISESLRQNYALEFNGTRLTPQISGDTFSYDININQAPFAGQIGNGNNLFENELITLTENLTVVNCVDDAIVEHTVAWGCDSDVYCQITSPKIGDFNVLENLPLLATSIQNKPSPAWNAPVTYTYTLSNDNNAANAYNVQVNIGYIMAAAASGQNFNPLVGNDNTTNRQLSNFRFSGGSNFSPRRWDNTIDPSLGTGSYYIPEDFFRGNPDGRGGLEDLDGDGFFDDLAPGSQLNLNFDLTMLPTFPGCSTDEAQYVKDLALVADFWSVTDCGTASPTLREDVTRQKIGRESLFEWINPMEYDLEAIDGQGFNLNFIGNLIVTNESPSCSGTEMLTNDPSTTYLATINLPNGINLSSSADSRYTQVGNQVIFTEPNLANYARNDFPTQIPVNFPLFLDCSVYNGPITLEIFYTTSYASDCFNADIHCGVFEIKTFCDVDCPGPGTANFSANRATPGWVDSNMTQRVTLDPNVHGTKYYMPKDEMVINSTSIMNNHITDNLFFELKYIGGNNAIDLQDIISFDFGNITVNDLSSGSATTTIDVAPTLNTVNGNEHTLTFDLSSYKNSISPSYIYGQDAQEDRIDLELHFKIKDELPTRAQLYQLSDFSGIFYSIDSENARIQCRERNDRAFFFQNETEIEPNLELTTTTCGETWLEITMETRTGANDVYPNEFRPPILWQSATFNLPNGLIFNNNATSEGFPLIQPMNEDANVLNDALSFNASGNSVTVSPSVAFRNHDQQTVTTSKIRIPVIRSSALQSPADYDVSIEYLDYGYSDAPQPVSITEDRTFDYQNTNFDIDTNFPVVSGSSAVTSFTAIVSTDSMQLLEYNWLRVSPESDFTVTAAFLVENNTEVPLNMITAADGFYIEFGDIEGGTVNAKTIRFEGTFNDCSPQIINVSQNYDCIGYPTDYEGIPFFNEREFILDPVSMAIQLDILEQPTETVDMCSDYAIVLEVRNAGEGDFIDPTITFSLPRDINALQVSNVEVEYPRNSGNIESISAVVSGNSMVIALNQHSAINPRNSISGSLTASNLDEQIAIVNLTLNPQCSYQSNSGITFEANGRGPCGDPEIGDGSRLASNPIIITGAEPPYSANSLVINSTNFEGCDQQVITVETALVDGMTGSNDFSRIILPEGLLFVEDSFVSTGNMAATFVMTNIINNQQEVEILMPAGADRNDIISYNFAVESTANICEGTYTIGLTSYVSTTGLTCNGQSCGTTEILTGQAEAAIDIAKAAITESSVTANVEVVEGSGNNNYQINFGIQNTGNANLDAGITYAIFCADAAGIKSETSIYSGTVGEAIPVGATVEENISFNAAQFCGGGGSVIIEFNSGDANCFCEPFALSIPVTLSPFEGIITFDINNILVNEDVGAAVLNVVLIGQSQNAFTLEYTMLDDTALQGEDYTASTGLFNFNGTDGETYPITIPITDDQLLEDLEFFNVLLSDISTDVVGISGNGTGVVGIIDNEFDTDGDSQPDLTDIDDDNDGILDTLEGDGSVDSDGDGIPDSLDIDDDNDGIPTNVEAQTTTGYIPPSGNDSDNDGLDDAYEGNGDDGLTPVDNDADGVPDFLDLDSDNDSVPDNNEGNDFNFDGIPDDIFTGTDADGDGLDDGYEGNDLNDGFDVNDEINDPENDLPDTDGTDDVNYRDINDDGDGINTINEDFNEDGDPTNDDEDADGTPDYLDLVDDRFNIPLIEDITILCGDEIPPLPDLTAIGICGTVDIVFSEEILNSDISDDYIIERTWMIEDTCGSTKEINQLIYVIQPELEEVAIEICIEDETIDLLDYLPQGFDRNGIFTENSTGITLNGSNFDPMLHQRQEYQISYSSTEGVCKYFVNLIINVTNDCVPCNANSFNITKTITINGDGVNDFLEIGGAEFCDVSFNLMVFNRWGNKVFESKDYKNNWAGFAPENKIGSSGTLPSGTYYYIIDIISQENPKQQINGYIYLGAN